MSFVSSFFGIVSFQDVVVWEITTHQQHAGQETLKGMNHVDGEGEVEHVIAKELVD